METSLVQTAFTLQSNKENGIVFSWLQQKRKETTMRCYQRVVEAFVSRFPDLGIKNISVEHIAIFIDERNRLSDSSINVERNVLSSLFGFCVELGYIERNPVRGIKPRKVAQRNAFRILTEQQVQQLIAKTTNNRDRLIIKLLYLTGLRVSELCSITWSSFKFRARGVQLVVVGKGNKTRSILLPEAIWTELQALKPDENFDVNAKLFQSQMGASITPTRVFQIVKGAGIAARLTENISPHWLRHCHATHALERGAPLHVVKQTLGHESLETTGRYLDALPGESSGRYLVL